MSAFFTGIISSIDPAMFSLAFFESDGAGFLIFLLLLSGPIYYLVIHTRYRNRDKRHLHEKETPAQMSNLQSYDNYVERLMRQNSSRLKGENGRRVEGSLVQKSGVQVMTESLPNKR